MQKEIDKYVSKRGQKPYLLLLQNHGLFISADTVEELRLKFKDFMNMVEAQLTRRPPYGLECVVGGMEKELRGLYGRTAMQNIIICLRWTFSRTAALHLKTLTMLTRPTI